MIRLIVTLVNAGAFVVEATVLPALAYLTRQPDVYVDDAGQWVRR